MYKLFPIMDEKGTGSMELFGRKTRKNSKHTKYANKILNQNSSHKELISTSLEQNLQEIMNTYGHSTDLVVRRLEFGKDGTIPIGLIYIDGLTDSKDILEALMQDLFQVYSLEATNQQDPLSFIKDRVLSIGQVKEANAFETLYKAIASGDTVILLDGNSNGLISSNKNWKERSITEPATQTVIRGPREGFTETMRTNTSLLRRKIKDPNLHLENKTIGRVTQTDVSIMYIKGIVNEKVLQEVRDRLDQIKIDGILESGYIEELIQDAKFSPFPTIYNTERPDTVAAGLLEGRVAILVDGTPFVLLVPHLFSQFFHSSEDYYQRADFVTLIRIIRYIGLFIALLAPSLYIAITTFHQELLPTALLIGLAAQREGVPFPAFVEALAMEVTFEILREAGVRMPKAIGQSISIVGTLVIGQAAVEAGLVSAAMVIIVSITAISNFIIPAFNLAISVRMIRFGFMGLAASFGLYGIFIGLVALVLHLCSLRSFGMPFMAPFAPFILQEQKDTIFRLPQWALLTRP